MSCGGRLSRIGRWRVDRACLLILARVSPAATCTRPLWLSSGASCQAPMIQEWRRTKGAVVLCECFENLGGDRCGVPETVLLGNGRLDKICHTCVCVCVHAAAVTIMHVCLVCAAVGTTSRVKRHHRRERTNLRQTRHTSKVGVLRFPLDDHTAALTAWLNTAKINVVVRFQRDDVLFSFPPSYLPDSYTTQSSSPAATATRNKYRFVPRCRCRSREHLETSSPRTKLPLLSALILGARDPHSATRTKKTSCLWWTVEEMLSTSRLPSVTHEYP